MISTLEWRDKTIPVDVRGSASGEPPRRIHVLLVITGLAAGGATKVVLDLASYFHNHPDFDLQLVTGPIPNGRTDVTYLAHEQGIPIQLVPSLVNRIHPLSAMKAMADLRRIMVQGEFDVVHTHSSVAGIVGRLAAATAGVPVVVHHVHGWALHDDMSKLTRAVYLNLERISAKFTHKLIAVAKTDISKGVAHRIAREEKFSLVYNGIDLDRFRRSVDDMPLREQLGLKQDSKLVGMIGRLDQQKNPLDLIRTASIVVGKYPKTQFLVVGDGVLRCECERLIDELGLQEHFFLLGHRDDVADIVPALTITAMSSLWEGLPLAFLESMSAGKPIVANDVDGANDVVINGETGFLVTPRQPAEMAERILLLLNDEELCDQMGRVAQQRSNYFSVDRMVCEIEALYKRLLWQQAHSIKLVALRSS